MKNKVISIEQAMNEIKDGMTLMVGGFMSIGTPEILMNGIIKNQIKELTIIADDAGTPTTGVGKLVHQHLVRRLIVSHIGLNPEVSEQVAKGMLEVTLVPQGTLAERIRSGGYGLGGVLTPTGIGTEAEKGKQKIVLEGKEYIIELPLKADVALIRGSVVDLSGNIFYHSTTRNFNPVMATAAKCVIVAAEKIVGEGELDPHLVMTPGIFTDYIVGGEHYDER